MTYVICPKRGCDGMVYATVTEITGGVEVEVDRDQSCPDHADDLTDDELQEITDSVQQAYASYEP